MHPTDVYARYENVRKSFGATSVLDGFTVDIHRGEIFVLVGASGCGKSTVLQVTNQLLPLDGGTITIDGVSVVDIDPVELRRRIGYVIQQIGLFPHRTVADNIGTLCSLLRWPRPAIRERVATLMDLIGLPVDQYGDRYPHELSGGQQQRVGVARALAIDPPLLLMDEPFAALDPQIRRSLQLEFRSWVERLGTTVVFVSHDVEEAIIVGDRLGVMGDAGRLAQVGTPLEVLAAPADDHVRGLLGHDRALRQLAVTPLDLTALRPIRSPDAPRIPAGTSLQGVLITLLNEHTPEINVVDERDRPLGAVSFEDVGDQARRTKVWS